MLNCQLPQIGREPLLLIVANYKCILQSRKRLSVIDRDKTLCNFLGFEMKLFFSISSFFGNDRVN